ncbi:hypothetical protein J6590_036715 [Homalodisca vitripennis]|nr:hypothetical protein J6590_036715 [Homalodisca vitripennis]
MKLNGPGASSAAVWCGSPWIGSLLHDLGLINVKAALPSSPRTSSLKGIDYVSSVLTVFLRSRGSSARCLLRPAHSAGPLPMTARLRAARDSPASYSEKEIPPSLCVLLSAPMVMNHGQISCKSLPASAKLSDRCCYWEISADIHSTV